MNIVEGDLFVVGGRDYPIKSCAEWAGARMNTRGFMRMANLTILSAKISEF